MVECRYVDEREGKEIILLGALAIYAPLNSSDTMTRIIPPIEREWIMVMCYFRYKPLLNA